MESILDPLFEKCVKEQKLPGVAATVLDRPGKALYKNVFGSVNINDPAAEPYTSATTTIMWSCTKLLTSISALQLIEQGKLSLDDPVEQYVGKIKDIKVIDKAKSTDSEIQFCPAQETTATILHLFTHTAGFTYDFWDQHTLQWRTQSGQTPHQYGSHSMKSTFETPLNYHPGREYSYGVSIDWLGFVVEAISGLNINEYIQEHIAKPLGMSSTTGILSPPDQTRMFTHLRIPLATTDGGGDDDSSSSKKEPTGGNLVAIPAIQVAVNPECYGGGGFIYSTLDDYSKLLVTVLNYGTHPESGAKILERATVEKYLMADFIPSTGASNPTDIGKFNTVNPQFSLTGQMLPSEEGSLGWSCGLMINKQDTKYGGRKGGSGAWAGLGNLYYWIDWEAGLTGMIMTSILPFLDPHVLDMFDKLEKTAYGVDLDEDKGRGKNYSFP